MFGMSGLGMASRYLAEKSRVEKEEPEKVTKAEFVAALRKEGKSRKEAEQIADTAKQLGSMVRVGTRLLSRK